MKSEKIVRSWKDEDYRLSLSSAEQSLLPDHPAGLIELTDAELNGVDGGTGGTFTPTCGLTICLPTLDYGICSCFTCVTWVLTICYPY